MGYAALGTRIATGNTWLGEIWGGFCFEYCIFLVALCLKSFYLEREKGWQRERARMCTRERGRERTEEKKREKER